jgi:membrane-bound lytic murein transglycosylase A
MRSPLVIAPVMVVMLGGCAHQPVEPPPAATLEIMHVDGWPALADDFSLASLQAACSPSIDYFERVPSDRVFTFGPVGRSAAELADGTRRACEIIAASAGEIERRRALQDEFLLLRSVGRDGRGEVLFTGYYEPLLDARREASESFEHPVYGVPSDVVTVDLRDFGVESDPSRVIGRVDQQQLVPYYERDAIDFGDGLPTDADVIGYVDDPVDAFFLHVQGSGTLVFPDGGRVRAGFAETNGRPYRSIGRLLIDDGLVSREEMSMQAIRSYLENNPDELRRVLTYNPSYVFFRVLPVNGGPLGCYGEPVTGGRSIATDRRLFPAPVMAWISAVIPTSNGGDEPISRFVLNQDTGGSIRGPGRVDLFFGQGDAAGELAGRTKHLGELYFLLPKRKPLQLD